jgi:hypothetical protein
VLLESTRLPRDLTHAIIVLPVRIQVQVLMLAAPVVLENTSLYPARRRVLVVMLVNMLLLVVLPPVWSVVLENTLCQVQILVPIVLLVNTPVRMLMYVSLVKLVPTLWRRLLHVLIVLREPTAVLRVLQHVHRVQRDSLPLERTIGPVKRVQKVNSMEV